MKSDPKTIKTLYPTTRGTVNRKKDGELEDGRSVHSMSLCIAIRSASGRAQLTGAWVKDKDVNCAQMEPIGCPETSVRNYHYSLRK